MTVGNLLSMSLLPSSLCSQPYGIRSRCNGHVKNNCLPDTSALYCRLAAIREQVQIKLAPPGCPGGAICCYNGMFGISSRGDPCSAPSAMCASRSGGRSGARHGDNAGHRGSRDHNNRGRVLRRWHRRLRQCRHRPRKRPFSTWLGPEMPVQRRW